MSNKRLTSLKEFMQLKSTFENMSVKGWLKKCTKCTIGTLYCLVTRLKALLNKFDSHLRSEMKKIKSWANHIAKCFVTFGMFTITLYHITEDPNKDKIDSTSLLQKFVTEFENNSLFEVTAENSNFNYRRNILKKNCWKYLTARRTQIINERRPECIAEHLPGYLSEKHQLLTTSTRRT